ncbi:MAG: hypothetical protein WCE68_16490 [Anaerolineales bacterium]
MPVNMYQRKSVGKAPISPLWRGIGCILMGFLPLITFGLTYIFTPVIAATGYPPVELLRPVTFPDWVNGSRIFGGVTSFISGIDNLWLGLIVFVIGLIVLTGLGSVIYTAVLQLIGPPRYSETDAPPSRYKAKVYRR